MDENPHSILKLLAQHFKVKTELLQYLQLPFSISLIIIRVMTIKLMEYGKCKYFIIEEMFIPLN